MDVQLELLLLLELQLVVYCLHWKRLLPGRNIFILLLMVGSVCIEACAVKIVSLFYLFLFIVVVCEICFRCS